MAHLPVVFGEWVEREAVWNFDVDKARGGRMFYLEDGCTLQEVVHMAKEDYNLTNINEIVELSYPLPEVMRKEMDEDTPPTFISSDRQVRSLIQLSRAHVVRLCVSTRVKVGSFDEEEDEEIDGDYSEEENADEEEGEADEEEEDADEEEGEEVGEEVDEEVGEGLNEGVKADHSNAVVKDEVYDSDSDYSEYGRVKGEREEFVLSSKVGRLCLRGIHAKWSDKIHVGKSFPSKDKIVSELRTTAINEMFAFKVRRSEPEVFVAKCRVQGCLWKLRASVKNEHRTFFVTIYEKIHTCSIGDRSKSGKNCSPKYIGKLFMDSFGIIDGITPKHIQVSMKTLYTWKMDYSTSYRALLHAQVLVRGTAEEGYGKLPSYLRGIEKTNPGTSTDLVVGPGNCFKYVFISFGASIFGFQYCRRVVVVDGTHLIGKFEGVLLVAAGQDANFQIFPLAFGIVDIECDESSEWFFTNLQKCFHHQSGMVLVSDRHSSIANACEKVMPWVRHGICYYHLQQNIVTKYRGKEIIYLVKKAAYAYTVEDYNHYMETIKEINPLVFNYLIKADPRLWSRVHFPGHRYNIKTSNIAESINAALKVAKGFPIVFLLEFIRNKLGNWFYQRREDALSLTTIHSRGVETLLAIRDDYAGRMEVQRIDEWKFYVTGSETRDSIVDLGHASCSCGLFQVEKIPCTHALAAISHASSHMSKFVPMFYARDYLYATYGSNISTNLLPPEVKPRPGRRKKSRWETLLELAMKRKKTMRKITKHYNCSNCKKPGHTRPKCVKGSDG